jgi:hypothetical protein
LLQKTDAPRLWLPWLRARCSLLDEDARRRLRGEDAALQARARLEARVLRAERSIVRTEVHLSRLGRLEPPLERSLSARLNLRPRVLLFIIRAQSRPLKLRRIEPQLKSRHATRSYFPSLCLCEHLAKPLGVKITHKKSLRI